MDATIRPHAKCIAEGYLITKDKAASDSAAADDRRETNGYGNRKPDHLERQLEGEVTSQLIKYGSNCDGPDEAEFGKRMQAATSPQGNQHHGNEECGKRLGSGHPHIPASTCIGFRERPQCEVCDRIRGGCKEPEKQRAIV